MEITKILEELSKSHSPFGVVKNIDEELISHGFTKLSEEDDYKLESGKGYFTTRNDSSLIAFVVPIKEVACFAISESHTDSPTFKVKPNPVVLNKNIVSLNVEPYGGMIMYSWIDRPLSLAGRIYFLNEDRKIEKKLVDIDEDLLYIPSVAIHMKRDINTQLSLNPAIDTIPMISLSDKKLDFCEFLSSKTAIDASDILSFDLFLYVRESPRHIGLNKEFIASPRLDDLVSVYSSLSAFLNAKSKHDVMPLFVAFDNEEVGSLTKQGADSTFLEDTIERISKALEIDEDEKHKILSRSFALSVDNAHANHPNHPEFSDQTTDVRLGEGVVIKYNANQSYTSDAKSVACLTSIAKSSDIKLQNFTNKNDLRGGSTLGNISNSHLSLNTVDIGIPQLAMHSSLEICAAKDIVSLIELIEAFYTSYDQSLIA